MADELESTWTEAVIGVLFRYLPGGTEETQENVLEQSISGPRFELLTFGIRVKTVTAIAACSAIRGKTLQQYKNHLPTKIETFYCDEKLALFLVLQVAIKDDTIE
jgi:uncharacterized BrkB/YihY/UPF0761 family membrane protein